MGDKKDSPFHVTLDTGAFVDGFKDEDVAKANAESRNKAAVELGIKARYKAVSA